MSRWNWVRWIALIVVLAMGDVMAARAGLASATGIAGGLLQIGWCVAQWIVIGLWIGGAARGVRDVAHGLLVAAAMATFIGLGVRLNTPGTASSYVGSWAAMGPVMGAAVVFGALARRMGWRLTPQPREQPRWSLRWMLAYTSACAVMAAVCGWLLRDVRWDEWLPSSGYLAATAAAFGLVFLAVSALAAVWMRYLMRPDRARLPGWEPVVVASSLVSFAVCFAFPNVVFQITLFFGALMLAVWCVALVARDAGYTIATVEPPAAPVAPRWRPVTALALCAFAVYFAVDFAQLAEARRDQRRLLPFRQAGLRPVVIHRAGEPGPFGIGLSYEGRAWSQEAEALFADQPIFMLHVRAPELTAEQLRRIRFAEPGTIVYDKGCFRKEHLEVLAERTLDCVQLNNATPELMAEVQAALPDTRVLDPTANPPLTTAYTGTVGPPKPLKPAKLTACFFLPGFDLMIRRPCYLVPLVPALLLATGCAPAPQTRPATAKVPGPSRPGPAGP